MIESKEQGIGKSMSGKTAPLNERGYKGVAKLRSQKQMEIYVRRLVASQGLYVVDDGALKGMVPYYSGAKATQSFKALTTEIEKAEKKKKHSWVSSTYKPPKEEPPPRIEEEEEGEPEARPSLSDLVVKPKKNNEKKKKKDALVQTRHTKHGDGFASEQWFARMKSAASKFAVEEQDDDDRDVDGEGTSVSSAFGH